MKAMSAVKSGLRVPLLLILAATVGAASTPAQEIHELLLTDEGVPITSRLDIGGEDADAIYTAWLSKKTDVVLGYADAMIKEDKLDHRGYALRYLALFELGKDRKRAYRSAVRATQQLGAKPDQLVPYIQRALYHDPQVNEYQLALMALIPAMHGAKSDMRLKIAHLRALAGCGNFKVANATYGKLVEQIGDDIDTQFLLVRELALLPKSEPIVPLVLSALDRVAKARPDDRNVAKWRFKVLHDLAGKPREADAIADQLLDGISSSELNNWVWYLLTRRPDAEHFDALALRGARRMLKMESIEYNEYDTIALALFRAGYVQEAIDNQRTAIANGGKGDPDYHHRMKLYENAMKARKASKDATSQPTSRPDGKDG